VPKKRPSEKPESLEFGPFGPRNLKQVYQFIDFSPTIPPHLRYAGLGGLLMTATIHASIEEQPPLEVLAGISTDTKILREALAPANARRKGYSDGAINNWTSLVTRCVAASGVRVRVGRRRVPLPDPWQALVDQLDDRGKMVLYPFMRWAVEEGYAPAQITQDALERYGGYLEACVLRKRVRAAYRAVVRQWCLAQRRVPGWPQAPVALIVKTDTYILPWTAFGEGFSIEVEKLMAAAANPDVTVRGRRKRLGKVSVKHQTYQLRRIASALVHATGCTAESITSVKQLVHPTAAREALRYITARAHKRQKKSNKE
jgi:hypothetical protein